MGKMLAVQGPELDSQRGEVDSGGETLPRPWGACAWASLPEESWFLFVY